MMCPPIKTQLTIDSARFSFARLGSALLILSLISACADVGTTSGVSGTDKIINGQDESGHPYVVSLIRGDGATVCTGSLIAPSVVLTAAHCIKSESGSHPPVMVELGSLVGAEGNTRVAISSHRMHEAWESADGLFHHEHDIALLYLSQPLTVSSVTYSSASSASLLNQRVLGVGYGVNNGFQQSGSGVKRSVTMIVSDATPDYFIVSWEGDVPLSTCQGDSGGPALWQGPNGYEVVGVVSNGPRYCQGFTQYTSVGSHYSWIAQNMGAEGASPQAPAGPYDQARYTTCAEVNQCGKSCRQNSSDQLELSECKQRCQAESSATALSHFAELMSCGRGAGCAGGDAGCYSAYCADQMQVCGLSPSESVEPPEEPITSCSELMGCSNSCDAAYPDPSVERERSLCAELCYARVTQSVAISDFTQLNSCIARLQQSCREDRSCLESSCEDELIACDYPVSTGSGAQGSEDQSLPPSPTPTAGASCAETYDCLSSCSSDMSCSQACLMGATEEALRAFNALSDCYQMTMCSSLFDDQCLSRSCPDQFFACR